MIQVILIVTIGVFSGHLHPFHLSICELEYDTDSKSIQITSRLFQDDFEVALDELAQSKGYFSQTGTSEAKKDLQDYFDQHLRVSINDQPYTHKFLGFEIEENVVWCYLEIERVDFIGEISIQYSALVDTFNDQINLAHIRYQGKVKSLKFQRNQLSGTASFTN
ncbi:MAG: DUF6702 family protein [Aurantibacter sp.]